MLNLPGEDYPGNQRFGKNKKEVTAKVEEGSAEKKKFVAQGTIMTSEKPLLIRWFGKDSNMSVVAAYVFWDVLLPAAKSTLSDIVSHGIEMMLYGESSPRARRGIKRDRDSSYVSYNSLYDERRERNRERDDRTSRRKGRHNFDEIYLETRREAEEVLFTLAESIDKYGSCTVADFYEAVGLSTEFTDNKYGWNSITTAEVRRNRLGYIVDMPRPEQLS